MVDSLSNAHVLQISTSFIPEVNKYSSVDVYACWLYVFCCIPHWNDSILNVACKYLLIFAPSGVFYIADALWKFNELKPFLLLFIKLPP